MADVRIIDTTSDTIINYAMCGYKNPKNEGYRRKMEWLEKRFEEGIRYKILYSETDGAVGGIEYIPSEYTWRAIHAPGYMVIHCIYIMSRKYKEQGYGRLLLDACLEDSEKNGFDGVAVVTRKGTWMADDKLFFGSGFELVEEAAPDFKLLAKHLKKPSSQPRFTANKEDQLAEYGDGLTMICSDQCPYTAKAQSEIAEVARDEFGLNMQIVDVKDPVQAQNSPCAFGSFCMLYQGVVIADHPISKTRFKNILTKVIGKK